MVTLDEVLEFGALWFDAVANGAKAAEQMHRPSACGARGTVYWQVEIAGRKAPHNLIKAVVGEDWILERAAGGKLKFVLYLNTFHHFLPDSAPLDL